jgi:hypothetical protein
MPVVSALSVVNALSLPLIRSSLRLLHHLLGLHVYGLHGSLLLRHLHHLGLLHCHILLDFDVSLYNQFAVFNGEMVTTTPTDSQKDCNRITLLVVLYKATFSGKNFDLIFLVMISDAKRFTVVDFLIVSQNGELASSLFVSKPLVFPVNHNLDPFDINTMGWDNDFCLNPVISLVT